MRTWKWTAFGTASLAAAVATTGSVHADEGGALVTVGKDVSVRFGEGCGTVRASVPALGPNRNSLVLAFEDFSVEASGDPTPAPRVCDLAANITLPEGMTLRPVAAFADGETFTSENGGADIEVRYGWTGDARFLRKGKRTFGRGVNEAFVLETERHGGFWSRCPGEDSPSPFPAGTTFLEGTLAIRVWRAASDKQTSELAVFNSEAQSVRWIWEWGSCAYNEKTYRSRYTNTAGRWISGSTTLVGSGGRYETDGGAKGTFYDVSYEDKGRIAKGLWRFDNGGSGWFVFRLEPSGRSFDGDWGEGTTIGVNRKGRWKGER